MNIGNLGATRRRIIINASCIHNLQEVIFMGLYDTNMALKSLEFESPICLVLSKIRF